MIKSAVITVSDKGSKGERIDETGPLIKDILLQNGFEVSYYNIIPDEKVIIRQELTKLSDSHLVSLIITNGGTGFSQRDVTPEATLEVIEKHVPGIGEAMRMKSLEITPKAILSRGISGIRKKTLIVNLPGSPKGAKENLEFVIRGFKHGIEILMGETTECAEPVQGK